MTPDQARAVIEEAFDASPFPSQPPQAWRDAAAWAIEALDSGEARIAEPDGDDWRVNAWLRKAVLLTMRMTPGALMAGAAGGGAPAWDKIPLKTTGWTAADFRKAGFRMTPGALVRRGAYIAPNAVLMPSFVNIGARVGESAMIDGWATVGSCAQIGARVHVSGGAGIGGVLEPLQAAPVIIEDDCFIGARAEVAEGVRVRRGSALAMGVYLAASTPIIDRETGEVFRGETPPYSVIVPGTRPGRPLPNGEPGPSLYCAVIVKTADSATRAKTALNDMLRT